jgi:predicted transcriptional regulator
MILADTTLTRKSTAMDLSVDLLAEVDDEAILATDGSIEGLFSALSTRPGRPSVFLRDEFSGLLEMMARKDYYAGMGETLTKLYDGKFQKKILRRETIEVKEPVLILFAGGIKDRILSQLTYEHVASGFMPRFLFITAESDPSKVRPLGPPTEQSTKTRDKLMDRLRLIHNHYARLAVMTVNGREFQVEKKWDAKLTPEAWSWYNKIEHSMMSTALKSPTPELMTPTFDRMCKSGLKVAVLLAAADRLEDEVVVTVQDLVRAFAYIEEWRGYTMEVMNNVGKTASENMMSRIIKSLKAREVMLRSEIMNNFHLTARDADVVFSTLEQRGLINREKHGKTERISITVGGHSG